MATIRKKGDYQWHAQIRKKGFPSQTRTFETRDQAERWARAIEREMEAGEFRDRRPAAELLLSEALRRYRDEVSPSNKGHAVEKLRLERFINDKIAEYSLGGLSPEAVIDYRDRRLERVSSGTVRRELDLLSQVIGTAMLEWQIPLVANPVSLVRRPPPSKPRERRLRNNEESLLSDSLAAGQRTEKGTFTAGTRNPWIQPLYELAIETAARRSELLRSEWRDVHLSERYIWKADTKNGDARAIPLTAKAVEILTRLRAMHEKAETAARIAGKPYADQRVFKTTENAVKKAWARAKEREGIKDLRWHDLRHEGTTRAAQKLGNIIELSAFTGHKDPRQLKRYYNPTALDIAKKLDG
ncbi:integrase [Thauera mechernichensis]|uniref:Integrase n=1 Tax=Thauera mechernichensis TaxID=82788 RepID=A0ABW3WKT5_9RHOO|nr:site-specific integrase [Thauera mechernichensis]MDG3066564.1 site-specific integrase [Thauera mechernichensis]